MRFYKLLLSVLLSVIVQFADNRLIAQDLDESNFIRYTRLDGLSNNYISGIIQDSTGYIWISTHKGLNRFDGKIFQSVFKNSSHSWLPDNLIVRMHHNSGEIIGATRAGGFAFDPASGQNKQFIIPCDSTIFFWTNHVFDIEKDQGGNYILSTKTGLYIFNGQGKLIKRYDHHTAHDVGRLELIFGGWVSSLSNGFTLQQNGLLGSMYDPYNNRIDTLFISKKENLKKLLTDTMGEMKMAWAGRHEELFVLNPDNNTIDVADIYSSVNSPNPMPFPVRADLGWTSKLTYINDSLLAITCKNNGFYLLHYDSHTMKLSGNGKKYFNRNVCTSVFKDREGRWWVGSTDGIYKQNLHNSFFSVTDLSEQSPKMLDHEIRSIYIDGDSIYAGLWNEGGLLVLDKKTGHITNELRFNPKRNYSNTIINIFPYDADTLWIATSKGIDWMNKKNYHYGSLKVPPDLEWIHNINPRCFFEDSKKNVWISFGRLNSLVRYDRATRTFMEISSLANPLLRITYIFSIAEDLQGNIWLAGDGLCRWNTSKKVIDTLIPYPKVSKLLLNYMFILDRDNLNNLWLSSFNNEIIQFNCYSGKMYLRQPENNIVDGNSVTNSPIIHNNVWMCTDNGISAFNIRNYSVKQFTYADGLPSVAVTTTGIGSFYDKTSDRFYFGARSRLISFIPDVSLSHKSSPELFIEKISTRDSTFQPASKDIRLKYNQNNLSIVFNTINFTDPEENRFAWRSLNNMDSSWNELNDEGLVTLSNLDWGWHTIQLKLFSVNNRWPWQVRTLDVFIQPPFWKTPLFIVILVTGIAGLIFISYKNRINSVRNKEGEKARVQQLIAEDYKNRFELEQISNYFSSCFAGKSNVDDVLWDVSKNLIGRMNYEECIIYMWNEDKTKMLQKAAYGPKGNPRTFSAHSFDVSPGQGIVGHVIVTKESQLVADTRKDQRYRVDDMNRLSEICVPIIHDDDLIGIIDSEHQEENHFRERDVKILTTIATLVGNKIIQIESEQSLAIKQKEIALVNQQLAEAQLSALQTQMNPHFIFNSLNSIKGMILENERQKASRYLSKFAQMIRMTLNQSKEIFTTLCENLEHLENYLEMEKLRFDDSFTFRIVVGETIDREDTLIPTLMIQPLAENAIWHGLMQKEGEKKLLICFSQLGETISCTIEDNGIGINRSEQLKALTRQTHQSVGLSNIRNRIKIMNEKYHIGCRLDLADLNELSEEKTGTCALLCFNTINNKLYL
jgi:ligand-binding sensor domain-containing protein/putative methionine-R-sulfoxide reductase with GAF domain